ncbi:MAG: glutamate-semialdehyde -aminomutase [Thermomicrobiales bacterium]|nr:glutamate-semialdehyde -aminomutase [Thermomicrobiales bacterium]
MTVQLTRSRSDAARAELAAEFVAEFRRRTPRSAEAFASAKRVMPGGDTRTVAFHAPYPLTVERGQGCRFVDIDGNEYVDVLNNYTSLIHGHAHPAITEAVTEQLPKGTNYATAVAAQTRLAEIITSRVASVDLVRFTNSGTEATMNAVRAARAFTGRDLIVKMEGGYHGTYDDFEVSVHPDLAVAGSDDAPLPTLDTQGVPANTLHVVLVIPYNDVAAAERLFAERGDEIAAVIIEPVMGAGGMIPANRDFLEVLRALTIQHEALLIFDEVMTFRLEPGGVQEHYRVRPDLTSFAKIIGGGFPVGAFGGRSEVMEQFDPARPRPLWQSGTFNGNAITMIAGAVAMEHYSAAEVARINALGDRLREGFNDTLRRAGVTGVATGYGSFVGVHFAEETPKNYRMAARGDQTLKRLVHLGLLTEGIFCAPRLMLCTSTAMDEMVIDGVISAFGGVLERVA